MSDKDKILRNFYYNKLRARELRHKETKAEKLLWKRIRNRQANDLKFRRQHPIGYYIADFFCYEKSLIIELEGNVHERKEQKEYDQIRNEVIEEWLYTIIYFENEEVYDKMEKVIDTIIKTAEELISPLSS